jgi:hypothetical protein
MSRGRTAKLIVWGGLGLTLSFVVATVQRGRESRQQVQLRPRGFT